MIQKSESMLLEKSACCQDKDDIFAKCDIFDFMANIAGLSVLHPGGYKATNRLAKALHITNKTRVLDVACGKGTTAIYLAKKYGCSVVGIDITDSLLAEASFYAKKNGVAHKVSFKHADALSLPFVEGDFDAAVTQAVLVLVDDKERAIKEVMRVIKQGGYAGWIELSWKQEPTEDFMRKVNEVICAYCMSNVSTFEGWERIFKRAGVKSLETLRYSLEFGGVLGMIADEGFANGLKVLLRVMTNPYIRKRMSTVDKFFASHQDYFGYGLYIAQK
jgi:ubiquinone/menaquinone biosynthesis C-methylase UbiE